MSDSGTRLRINMGLYYRKYDIAKKRAKLDHPFLWWFFWKKECRKIDTHLKELDLVERVRPGSHIKVMDFKNIQH